MTYVKHIEYNKYGELKGNHFIQHKWVRKNYRWIDARSKEEKKKKLPVRMIKQDVDYNKYKEGDKPFVCGEFIHMQPEFVGPDFLNYFKEITYKEYLNCMMIDESSLIKLKETNYL